MLLRALKDAVNETWDHRAELIPLKNPPPAGMVGYSDLAPANKLQTVRGSDLHGFCRSTDAGAQKAERVPASRRE